jgi:hypothetical protein
MTAGRHLLVTVVPLLIDVPDRQTLIGSSGVTTGLAPILDEEIFAPSTGVDGEVVRAGLKCDGDPVGDWGTFRAQPDRRLRYALIGSGSSR